MIARFVVLKNPFPDKKDYADKAAFRAANEEVKKQRRRDLWAFTDPGMPGEASLGPWLRVAGSTRDMHWGHMSPILRNKLI